ncbi:primosomal protein N' [Alkanindiges sp. WGS2144]|uniref:primosomal protein N' n=1 Tax=Alkanindiges sp. WGS2144 TaxID=3366808 RepID=UPI0037515F98
MQQATVDAPTDLFESPLPDIIVQIALPVPIFEIFDYAVPENLLEQWPFAAGCRVCVPFGRRELVGIYLGQSNRTDIQPDKIKPIQQVLDQQALLPDNILKLLHWAASYYHYPVGEVISCALPTLLRQGRPFNLLAQYWRLMPDADRELLKRAPKQLEAFDLLNMHDAQGAPESVLLMMGTSKKQLQTLQEKGLAECFLQPEDHTPHPVKLAELPLTPNNEQQHAIDTIKQQLGKFKGILLDGLTGSGKTEVYLQAMQPVLEAGQQVLVLVPEIGLTPQTLDRFKSRFQCDVVAMHSNLTDVARLQAWQAAFTGKALIVIGTRSAVFTPMPRLGLIILDEEHDVSFKQQDTFRYHARDVALRRGQTTACPVVLGSATPCLESLHLVAEQKLLHVHLSKRAGNAALAKIQLIDLKTQSREHGLARDLIDAIKQRLKKNEQVLIFLNRRGYAPILLCPQCGWQADCPRCDAHLTVHYQPGSHLHCHHCNYQSRLPTACNSCQSTDLTPTGMGTARLEEGLKQLFADTDILRVDRDSTSRVGSWERIYERAHQEKAAILLGTQMLAKGHHFPHVTLVAILDVDGGFLSSDFRAPERTAQLIMQVAGRAGRGQKAGLVLIQTFRPENPLLQTLIQEGYAAFARTCLAERKAMLLPPYRYTALIRAEATQPEKALQFLQHILSMLYAQPQASQLEAWGPVPAPMEKRAGVFRAHVLIFCTDRRLLHQLLGAWWLQVCKLPERRGIRCSIDIDAQELS